MLSWPERKAWFLTGCLDRVILIMGIFGKSSRYVSHFTPRNSNKRSFRSAPSPGFDSEREECPHLKKKNWYEFQLNNIFFLLIWLSCHGRYSIIWPYFPFFLIMNFCAFNLLQIWINSKFFPLLASAAQVLHISSSYVLMLRPVFSCQLFDGQFWPVPLLKLHRTDISAPLQIGRFFFLHSVG